MGLFIRGSLPAICSGDPWHRRPSRTVSQNGVSTSAPSLRCAGRAGECAPSSANGAQSNRLKHTSTVLKSSTYPVLSNSTPSGALECSLRARRINPRGEVRPDAPVAQLVCVGQRGAFDRRAKTHRMQLGRVGRQTGLDVAQALAPAQLREGQGAELFCARLAAHTGLAGLALHDAREARLRYELHDPGERRLACAPTQSSGMSTPGSCASSDGRSSSRTKLNQPAGRANASSRSVCRSFNQTAWQPRRAVAATQSLDAGMCAPTAPPPPAPSATRFALRSRAR